MFVLNSSTDWVNFGCYFFPLLLKVCHSFLLSIGFGKEEYVELSVLLFGFLVASVFGEFNCFVLFFQCCTVGHRVTILVCLFLQGHFCWVV